MFVKLRTPAAKAVHRNVRVRLLVATVKVGRKHVPIAGFEVKEEIERPPTILSPLVYPDGIGGQLDRLRMLLSCQSSHLHFHNERDHLVFSSSCRLDSQTSQQALDALARVRDSAKYSRAVVDRALDQLEDDLTGASGSSK